MNIITLPRSVVEQALEALDEIAWSNNTRRQSDRADDARIVLRAALEQPQDHLEQHLDMVPAGWQLVPVNPTDAMVHAISDNVSLMDFERGARDGYSAMIAAAPQPPAVEQPQAVTDCHQSQPQGEQEPVAWQYRMRPDWGSKKDCWGPWQDCTKEQAAMYQRVPLLHDWAYESRQLYTHPQPKHEPLMDLVKDAFFEGFVSVETYNDTRLNSVEDAWAEYKAAHRIGGEA